MLRAGRELYREVLGGIPVVHILRHVVVHAADGVYELDKGVEVDRGVDVHLEAEDVREAVEHTVDAGLHPLLLGRGAVAAVAAAQDELVNLLRAAGDVHQRVARDAEDVYRVLLCVERAQHDGVGVIGDLVEADDEEGVHMVVMARGRAGVGVPRWGSGRGVALGSALSAGAALGVTGCTSPPPPNSGGFSQSA